MAPGVCIVPLGTESAVFNPASWETHVLNAAATLVLEQLQQRPVSVEHVESLLGDVLEEREAVHAGVHARRVLDELRALQLVFVREFKP